MSTLRQHLTFIQKTMDNKIKLYDNSAFLRVELKNTKARSAWKRGVKVLADFLIDNLNSFIRCGDIGEITVQNLEKILLNGAENWREYSYGGSAFIYDSEIAEALCTPSELRKCTRKDGTLRNPNGRENWLDCQARALYQAYRLLKNIQRNYKPL